MSKEKIIYTVITNWEELSDLVFNENSKGNTLFRELEDHLPKEYAETLERKMDVEHFFELVQKEMGIKLREPTLKSKIVNEKNVVDLYQKGIQITRVLNRTMMEGSLSENETEELTKLRKYHDETNPIYYGALQSSTSFEEIISKSIAYALSSVAYFKKRADYDIDWIISNIHNYKGPVIIESGISWANNASKISKALESTHNTQLKIIEQIAVEGENCNPYEYLYSPHVRLRRGLINGGLNHSEMMNLAAQDIIHFSLINSKSEEYNGTYPKAFMSADAKLLCKKLSTNDLKAVFSHLKEFNQYTFEKKIEIVKN